MCEKNINKWILLFEVHFTAIMHICAECFVADGRTVHESSWNLVSKILHREIHLNWFRVNSSLRNTRYISHYESKFPIDSLSLLLSALFLFLSVSSAHCVTSSLLQRIVNDISLINCAISKSNKNFGDWNLNESMFQGKITNSEKN